MAATAVKSKMSIPAYPQLMKMYLGARADTALLAIQALYTFMICVAYYILQADIVPDIMANFSPQAHNYWYSSRWFVMLVPAIISACLGSLKTLDALRFTSMTSLACIHVVVIAVVVRFGLNGGHVDWKNVTFQV